jgi:hypothetical protein
MERIGGETMVLYSDLRERLEAFEAMRSVASLPGEFVTKTVKGSIYRYFQTILPGGRTQIYIGPDNEQTRSLIEARETGKVHALADEKMFQRLAAQIMAGDVMPIMPEMARIVARLADCCVFRAGGVLVGTTAYQILGPHLGVAWEHSSRMTQDIDLVGDTTRVAVAVPNLPAEAPAAIDSLRMGFFPIPRLSHNEPYTSYGVRGKSIRIDLFTPARRGATAPVFIRRLNATATPLNYLDYLIESPIKAAMIAGMPCLVNVPQPARYALHKLIISQERDATSAATAREDFLQAKDMITLLKEDSPGALELAKVALAKRGSSWLKKVEMACRQGGIEL